MRHRRPPMNTRKMPVPQPTEPASHSVSLLPISGALARPLGRAPRCVSEALPHRRASAPHRDSTHRNTITLYLDSRCLSSRALKAYHAEAL